MKRLSPSSVYNCLFAAHSPHSLIYNRLWDLQSLKFKQPQHSTCSTPRCFASKHSHALCTKHQLTQPCLSGSLAYTAAPAQRKQPNNIWWCYHTPMIPGLPPHQLSARNSLGIRSMWKVIVEKMHVSVRWKKIPKNANESWNECKGYGKQHTIETKHTCWMSLQQLSGGLHGFTAVREAPNKPCGKSVAN